MALTTKQKLFCYYYLKLGDVKESAVHAGFPKLTAMYEGQKILCSKAGQDYISRLNGKSLCDGADLVKRGLTRLAFGSVNDAVTLLFSENEDITPETFEGLDLFNVSEIKRQKGGAVEIKFFDRQKALEALSELEDKSGSDCARSFFEALKSSTNGENSEV